MVHERAAYLAAALESLRMARGIQHVLLVISRDTMGEPVEAVVAGVRGV